MIQILKNLDFEKLKSKVIDKGKPLAIAGVCFLAVFVAGFGTGRVSGGGSGSSSASKRSLTNSNTNTTTQAKIPAPTKTATSTATAAAKPGAVDPANCYIKGSKSKIYHIPGGAFYDRTSPAACFNSEEEALAAGYTKSSR